jgi:hypothetical protein
MRRITMLALVVVLALVGAACGGDDDDSAADETKTTDDSATSDDGGDDGGSTDIGDFVDDDCEFLLTGAFQNPLASAQGGDIDFSDEASRLDEVADNAPDEIKDAMKTIADTWDEMADVLKDVDLSDPSSLRDPEVQQKFQQLSEIATDDYQAATEQLSTWLQENCTGAASN